MKKFGILILILTLCCVLCSCKSEEAKVAEELIRAIGTVTVDSGTAIEAAQTAFEALSEEDKAAVENAAALSEAAGAYLQAQIADLGEITINSAEAVTTVREAYDALPEDVKAYVSNADILQQAELTVKKLRLEEKLLGTWYIETTRYDDTKDEHNKYQYTSLMRTNHNTTTRTFPYSHPEYGDFKLAGEFFFISENGFYNTKESESLSSYLGSWTLSEDLMELVVDLEVEGLDCEQLIFKIQEEDGFTKLYGNYPYENALAFVHEEDVQAAFDAKYFYLEKEKADYRDFFGDPVDLGYLYDENGQRITALYEDGTKVSDLENVWLFSSKAYEKGLVYVDGNHFSYSFTFQGHNGRGTDRMPLIVTGSVFSDMKLEFCNDLLFVRADHVAKNYIDENGCRTLELTDGRVIRSCADDYFDEVNYVWKYLDVNYEDYIY